MLEETRLKEGLYKIVLSRGLCVLPPMALGLLINKTVFEHLSINFRS